MSPGVHFPPTPVSITPSKKNDPTTFKPLKKGESLYGEYRYIPSDLSNPFYIEKVLIA